MAFDRTCPNPTLEPATIAGLRAALARSASNGSHGDDLREPLGAAAREARERGIHAERLLVMLKDMWLSLPEVAASRSPDATNTMLQQLVSRCIREYYAL